MANIEAEDAKEATMVVPPTQRSTAKAIRLNKFSPEHIKGVHYFFCCRYFELLDDSRIK